MLQNLKMLLSSSNENARNPTLSSRKGFTARGKRRVWPNSYSLNSVQLSTYALILQDDDPISNKINNTSSQTFSNSYFDFLPSKCPPFRPLLRGNNLSCPNLEPKRRVSPGKRPTKRHASITKPWLGESKTASGFDLGPGGG